MIILISCREEIKQTVTIPIGAQSGNVYLEPDIYTVGDNDFKSHNGLIAVSENRNESDSRLIGIPIIQIHATGDSVAEPIFYLNGGPGVSNVGSYQFVADLGENHDIVLVGYRGVDGSVVLDCPEIDKFFDNSPGDITEKATIDSLAAVYSSCAKRLQNQGIDTNGYNITEVVQDIEDARRALGYDNINLLSSSYGTRLAMIYAWMYPKSIHRSVMISANPPGHFVWHPRVIDEQIIYYSELFQNDKKYGDRTKNLAESIRVAVQNMPDHWLLFPINKGNVLLGTFMMLYHTSTSPKIFDTWIAASEGDWSGIALLSIGVKLMMNGATLWGETAAKVTSADYIFEPGIDPYAILMPDNSIIGAPGSILGIAAAKGWPANIIADSLRHIQHSNVPTLLISGNIDFSTPARFARDELLPFLPNGHQVILSEFGHTGDIWGKQRDALNNLLITFFDTGIVDDSKYIYAPMSFAFGLGYPTIMKLIIAGAIFILVILFGIIWFVINRLSRKKLEKAY